MFRESGKDEKDSFVLPMHFGNNSGKKIKTCNVSTWRGIKS